MTLSAKKLNDVGKILDMRYSEGITKITMMELYRLFAQNGLAIKYEYKDAIFYLESNGYGMFDRKKQVFDLEKRENNNKEIP